jgi:hypothetical protein
LFSLKLSFECSQAAMNDVERIAARAAHEIELTLHIRTVPLCDVPHRRKQMKATLENLLKG